MDFERSYGPVIGPVFVSTITGEDNVTNTISDTTPILDIRSDMSQKLLHAQLQMMLETPDQQDMTLPFLFLYDEKGLQLFEQITKLKHYYPARTETQIIVESAQEIACGIQDNTILLELGSGSLFKTTEILDAFERSGKKGLKYFALDVDRPELARSLAMLRKYENIACYGLWGTFDDGFTWIQSMQSYPGAIQTLFLGSSIGNFTRRDAISFLHQASKSLRQARGDVLYVAFDHCKDYQKLWEAYHDPTGVHERFLMNALKHANRVCEMQLFDLTAWKADGRIDQQAHMHSLFYRALHDTQVSSRVFRRGDCLSLGHNIKYPIGEVQNLFRDASMREEHRWENKDGDYALYKLASMI